VRDEHPTSGDPATLRLEQHHAPFLRRRFELVRTAQVAHPGKLIATDDAPAANARTYANACGRIVEGIDRGEIVVDAEVRAVLLDEAAATDERNEHERVVGEHEAFAHLLRQLRHEVCRPHCGDESLQWTLLLAVLEPPAFGGFLSDLARQVGRSEAEVDAAAVALDDRLLAIVQDGYVAATGVAMEFRALCLSADPKESG
jgi:hypothetical protein